MNGSIVLKAYNFRFLRRSTGSVVVRTRMIPEHQLMKEPCKNCGYQHIKDDVCDLLVNELRPEGTEGGTWDCISVKPVLAADKA